MAKQNLETLMVAIILGTLALWVTYAANSALNNAATNLERALNPNLQQGVDDGEEEKN